MKTLLSFVAITAAALSTAPAQAQLLGGGLGGSMSNSFGGALNGSMADRAGTLDGRFASDHSLRTADAVNAQPNVSVPVTRTEKTGTRAIENEKQSAAVAEHSAAGKAESSGHTALNDGASGVHAGEGEAGKVKSAGSERIEQASKTSQPRANATNRQATAGDVGVQTPPAQARADDGAANNTHVSGGTAGGNASSQTASGGDASASVE